MDNVTREFVKLTTTRLKGCLTSTVDLGKLFEKQLGEVAKSDVNGQYNAEHNLKDIVDAAVSLRGIIKTLEELR
jgi:hypothetical protein